MTQEKPFVIRRTRNDEFRVFLLSDTGRKLLWSEPYTEQDSGVNCIMRTLLLDRGGPYSTILRLTKDKDTDGIETWHFEVVGNNHETMMISASVPLSRTGRIAEQIMAILDRYNPDIHGGEEFYEDQSRKPKAQ